jgi:Zn-dependent peptidase ImmA (M78 family)
VPELELERWCNRVAAELLMPLEELHNAHDPVADVSAEIQRLARLFKVSTLVALRRLFDAGYIDRGTLWQHYREELDRVRAQERGQGGGGACYGFVGARTGERFARAVVASTLEGHTLFTDAYRMLGVRKTSTFYEAARELGVIG